MALGLAQQTSILAKIERLRQENPALLSLIEQAQGFAFPEIIPPSTPRERPRLSFKARLETPSPPVVRSSSAFSGWSTEQIETGQTKKRRKVQGTLKPRRWLRNLNMSLTPTMVFRTKGRQENGVGGGEVVSIAEVLAAIEDLRITQSGDTRVTEEDDFRIIEDG